MLRNLKVLFVLFMIVVISVATYAFADANTVPDTKAGDGSGTVSGYTVTGVVYTLNANPATLDSVAFDLGAAAAQVQAQLVSGGTWYDCALDTGTVWECDTTGLTVVTIDQLRVVATSN
jgi:hypothetical protein